MPMEVHFRNTEASLQGGVTGALGDHPIKDLLINSCLLIIDLLKNFC